MTLPAVLTLAYWSPKRGAILIGFVLTILGSAGSQFFLDPPQTASRMLDQQSKDLAADIDTLKSAQAQYLMFQQQGALIYALNVAGLSSAAGNQRDIVGNLYQLSLIDRATALRTMIGQLAIANLADFKATSDQYTGLIDAARKDFSLDTYTAIDDFEKAVMDKASAQMASLQQNFVNTTQAKAAQDAIADERKLILLIVVTLGSTFLLLANLLSTKEETARSDAAKTATSPDDRVTELTTAQQLIALALEHAQQLNARRTP
jgi:hypothetical protein